MKWSDRLMTSNRFSKNYLTMVYLPFGTRRDECFLEHYRNMLVQSQMDHSKFYDLEKGLTQKAIVEKLTKDFEILRKFLIIRRGFPKVSYDAYMEL